MRKFLIALAAITLSLCGYTQVFQGSVQKNATPTKADIILKPDFNNAVGEYVYYLQIAVSLPDAVAGGLTASATSLNNTSNLGPGVAIIPYSETFSTPSTADDERVFGFVLTNAAVPGILPSWTNGTSFVGAEVTFNAPIPGNIKLLDLSAGLGGGGNSNTYFSILTAQVGGGGGDRTNYPALFFPIPGLSMTGNYSAAQGGDQYVETTSCSGAVGGTASSSASFCLSGTPNITASGYSSGSGSGYQWMSSTLLADYPNGGTPVVGQTNPASLTTGVVTNTTYYWLRVFCTSGLAVDNSTLVTVTINPQPNVTCPTIAPVCVNTAPFPLVGGTPVGGTYNGPGVLPGGVFDPGAAGPGPQIITYCYTDPATGCTACCVFTIFVHPLPLVNCPPNMTVCANAAAFPLVGGNPPGGVYSGPGVVGGVFNPAAVPLGTHPITYCFTDPFTGCSNCCTFTITVAPLPIVTCPPNITTCVSSAPFTLVGNPPGGVFTGPGVTAGVFNPSAAGPGAHTITYCYTDPSTGCSNCCQFTITVNPLPLMSCPNVIQTCITSAPFPLTGGAPAGGTYSGTGVSGSTFSPQAAGAGTHTITYSFTDGNGCSNSCSFTIIVNELPVVTCPANSSTNLNSPPFALTGGSPVGGTYSGPGVSSGNFNPAAAGEGMHTITYTLTNTATSCTNSCTFTITVGPAVPITCPPNSAVCIDAAPFTLTGAFPAGGTFSGPGVSGGQFNPAAAGVGMHTITYTTSLGICIFTITVNPLPVMGCPLNSSVCINIPAFALTGGTPIGGTYIGTGVSGGNFNPATAGVGAHGITYTYTDGNGCSASCTFTIIVNALPVVSCPSNSAVCINEVPFALTGGAPAGGSYNGPGVAGGIFDPAAAGAGDHGITYTYTDGNGCSNSCTFIITVNPFPAVGCPANTSLCFSAAAFALSGGTPIGGTYSGAGVSGGDFDPAAAGVGTHTITYTFTSTLTGCTNSCSFTITVNPLPTSGITSNGSLIFCDGESVVLSAITNHYLQVLVPQNITMPVSTAVFGPAISTTPVSGDFVYIPDLSASTLGCNPFAPGPLAGKVALIDRGTCLFTLKVKNAQDAGAIGVIIINNVATPLPTMGGQDPSITIPVVMVSQADGAILKNLLLLGTVNGMSMSPNTYMWSNGATTQNITVTQSGNYSVTVTNPFGCSSTSLLVPVTVLPVVNAGTISGPANLCVGLNATFTSDGTPGGTWSSSDPSVATVNSATGEVVAVGAGTTDIAYSFTDACGVPSSFRTLTVGYYIAATSGGNGTVTPADITWVDCNGRVTYTITPDPCYKISDVLIDGVSDAAAIMSGTYTFDNVSTNHTIHATFVLDGPFNIVATSGSDGSVSPPGTTSVACGANQTYTITPDPGFVTATVLIDGVNDPAAVSSGTYTFMNVQGPHTIHATFVTACVPTTVAIIVSSVNNFCANLALTAKPATPGVYTYEWKRGAIVVGTSQTLILTTASPDGVYCVTAASGPSCVSAPACYTYSKQGILQTYTILGIGKKVELGENNTVLNGSVGNTKSDGEIHIKKNAWIAGPGQFVKGKKIKVDNPSNVPVRIFAPAMVVLPAMMYNTTNPDGLLNITVSTNTTVVGNYKDVAIKKNKVVTLTGSIFKKIVIDEGAQVTFTSPVVNIVELEVKGDDGATPTRVKFSGNCVVKVKNKVKVEKNCQINSTARNVVFYVDRGDFEVKTKNTWVIASIYNPLNKIHLHEDGGKPGYMIGRFIANYIDGHSKYVTWNNYNCAVPPPPPPVAAENPGETDNTVVAKMEVTAYPNPSSASFSLKLKTGASGDVIIRVHSISGKLMQEVKGTPDQIFRVGDGLVPGIYIAELTQGDEKVMVKLVKQ